MMPTKVLYLFIILSVNCCYGLLPSQNFTNDMVQRLGFRKDDNCLVVKFS